jgi:hypothetical protein|tara:strand:- start:113 stop:481 length:369 start_codon:yes stop_codon:yes gene_type:complete
MTTNAQWTVVMEDKKIIKQSGDAAGTPYEINDNDFWGLAKWNNIWAIQYGTSDPSDTVEYRDGTPHSTWEDANLGDFSDFTSRWDSAHLAQLQSNWDNDNVSDETEADKIARLGSRPTSYSS